MKLLYKGTLRVLLVLLHDFPEFLCDNHFVLCEVIPPTCIQLRNLVLSAFPKAMRLPDPFAPNLKVWRGCPGLHSLVWCAPACACAPCCPLPARLAGNGMAKAV